MVLHGVLPSPLSHFPPYIRLLQQILEPLRKTLHVTRTHHFPSQPSNPTFFDSLRGVSPTGQRPIAERSELTWHSFPVFVEEVNRWPGRKPGQVGHIALSMVEAVSAVRLNTTTSESVGYGVVAERI